MLLKNINLLVGILLLISACDSRKVNKFIQNKEKEEYHLVWSDEFDYTGLPDSTKWTYDTEGNADGWGNREAQYYTKAKKENAWVENGVLTITALKEQFGGKEYTSARLNSKANWLHGRIEVNAKLPKGRGTWSAIWMMPKDWTYNDGNWPNIGEIDIMEHVGHNLGTIHASAHSKDYQWQKNTQQTSTIKIAGVDEKFHSYMLEWTPELMKAYVDNQLYFEYKNEGLGKSKWPYIKPFYLILNLAIGGAWGSGEGIDDSVFPQTMEIDYVRIYQKK
ncbi:family 16 glycosylhydrolase [Marinifilum sp. N1E240]|uniref:glycoside hydrolase family 16 protein n=1 Tax=Marinifilum sp. N1E240 TaxID=2608082 RepID=UPI00128BC9A1|nr:glycoside hydrolase family 16 protein [Marinifilum sp. N1E240]MPQ46693.1 family 16 glycosylhydrolase [Marinifilum sp. N1E240]